MYEVLLHTVFSIAYSSRVRLRIEPQAVNYSVSFYTCDRVAGTTHYPGFFAMRQGRAPHSSGEARANQAAAFAEGYPASARLDLAHNCSVLGKSVRPKGDHKLQYNNCAITVYDRRIDASEMPWLLREQKCKSCQ